MDELILELGLSDDDTELDLDELGLELGADTRNVLASDQALNSLLPFGSFTLTLQI